MWLKNYMFFHQYVIICHFFLRNFTSVNAMVGNNVRQAGASEFPFIAGIRRRSRSFDPSRHTICTGALISAQDVLTADHCLENLAQNAIEVIIGSVDLSSDSVYYAAWWISYQQWIVAMDGTKNDYPTNDICIIRIHGMVADDVQNFAVLSYKSYKDLKGKDVVLVGWGEINNRTHPKILQKANVKILSNTDCKERASRVAQRNFKIDKNVVCTSARPFILMMGGDSGGPLIYNNKVVAVNGGTCPFPQQRFHPEKINIHTVLKYYEQFIKSVLTL